MSNIDSSNNNHSQNFKIGQLYNCFQTQLNDLNFSVHNKKYTRYVQHQFPSCIDHIYLNCPDKFSPVETTRNTLSDHCVLTTVYKTKSPIFFPKFIKIQDRRKLSKDSLEKLLTNQSLSKLFFNILTQIL